ncbi:LytR/AlgR family response regulator transcription factor [Ignavigranum ruoffiae]
MCDDDQIFTGELERYLLFIAERQNIDFEIDIFFDGSGLIRAFEQHPKSECLYELLFLDIDMEEVCGIKVARVIIEYPNVPLIIFVSAWNHYMSDLFQFGTFRFFEKPIKFNLLEEAVYQAIQLIENKHPYFYFKSQQRVYRIVLKQIVYFESKQRLIYLYCSQGETHRFYGQLDDIEGDIRKFHPNFIRSHQSYLINGQYINEFDAKSVSLELNHERITLPISQSRRQEFLEQVAYLFGI